MAYWFCWFIMSYNSGMLVLALWCASGPWVKNSSPYHSWLPPLKFTPRYIIGMRKPVSSVRCRISPAISPNATHKLYWSLSHKTELGKQKPSASFEFFCARAQEQEEVTCDNDLYLFAADPFQHLHRDAALFAFHSSVPQNTGSVIERFLCIKWCRGGPFDIFNGGSTTFDLECLRNRFQDSHDVIPGNRAFWHNEAEISKKLTKLRAPIMIGVDSCKLVIATSYEVSIWPFPINGTMNEHWIQRMVTASESQGYIKDSPRTGNSARNAGSLCLDRDIQPFYCSRPFRFKIFDFLAERLNLQCSMEDFSSVVLSYTVTTKQWRELIDAMSSYSYERGPGISLATMSWRYLAFAAGTRAEEKWELHAFDALSSHRANGTYDDETGIELMDDDNEEYDYES